MHRTRPVSSQCDVQEKIAHLLKRHSAISDQAVLWEFPNFCQYNHLYWRYSRKVEVNFGTANKHVTKLWMSVALSISLQRFDGLVRPPVRQSRQWSNPTVQPIYPNVSIRPYKTYVWSLVASRKAEHVKFARNSEAFWHCAVRISIAIRITMWNF